MRSSYIGSVITALLLTGATWADEKGDDDDSAISQIARLGPGVHEIKRDDKGRIQSCIIVGQSRVSTVLGPSKGLEVARQRAQLAAKAEFVQWLSAKVQVYENQEDEFVLFLEGSRENDAAALKEAGKAIEKTGDKKAAVAESLVCGLQILHIEVSAQKESYTVVYGWDRKTAKGATKLRAALNDQGKEGTPPKPDGKGRDNKNADAVKWGVKKIEDEKVTSRDAKKFLKD